MSDRKRSSSDMAEGGSASTSKDVRSDATNPSSSSQGQQARRTRRLDIDPSKRGNRMFGLLNSTLAKAKEDNEKRVEAARKRAEIEARLQQKLQNETVRQKQLEELSKKLKPLVRQLHEIAIEIESKEAAIRLRKAQKRRLASFLITTSELSTYDGKIARQTSVDEKVLAPDVTLTLAPIGPRHPKLVMRPDSHPIYFLPKKNLNTQDDRLDEQEDRVDDEIDDADKAWGTEKAHLQDKMNALKDTILDIKSEMDKIEAGQGERSIKSGKDKADTEMQEVKAEDHNDDKMMETGA
ncbi:uncharacterized protein FA14DRAFT_37879 [Meira miltonrushii]|uniref:Pinin/SDK/MemA protein domain-containing protein n=1 Tax=Meira miltonrushii TaxID=1280837 RepID=A0A316VBS8_9BASI|nr:uncharacterized protein FA14DRAFT_37879 [Meira miltonrushii]PWN35117.1 hypothetical protein FA14DRAFT_37879 [Meira miltonrushii]